MGGEGEGEEQLVSGTVDEARKGPVEEFERLERAKGRPFGA